MSKNRLEDQLSDQLWYAGLTPPARQFRFASPRRWTFDFAWPERRLAVEVEGGTWVKGRHVRPQGYENDCEKYNAATELGWRILRYTSAMVKDGRALDQIERILSYEEH